MSNFNFPWCCVVPKFKWSSTHLMIKQFLWDITHHHQSPMVAGNITKKIQILSTPIHGELLQKHKMRKKIIWNISFHHKMIQVIIPMVAGSVSKKMQVLSSQLT
ncbi:hypothetical protein AHAS_Ahas15G0220200 [Arachis hypogaea]